MANQTVKLTTLPNGDLQLPIFETKQIHTWDYVIVKVSPFQDKIITVTKYDHPGQYHPGEILNHYHFIAFINYDKNYLKQQSINKSIRSHHQ